MGELAVDARRYGKLTGQIVWPGFACLSIWLVVGGMPATIEMAFDVAVWVFAVLLLAVLLVCFFSAELLSALYPPIDFEAVLNDGPDRIVAYLVNPSRLVLIVALFFAGRPILGACFVIGFAGLWGLRAGGKNRQISKNDG